MFCHLSTNFISANRIAPGGTPHFMASYLGLFCLPMPHKNDTKRIWVKSSETTKSGNVFYSRIDSNNYFDLSFR